MLGRDRERLADRRNGIVAQYERKHPSLMNRGVKNCVCEGLLVDVGSAPLKLKLPTNTQNSDSRASYTRDGPFLSQVEVGVS